MKLFGILVFSLLTSWVLFKFNELSGNGFIGEFIKSDLLQIATTLLGFNIAVHTILIGQILGLESTIKDIGHFKGTRRELKDNAYFNIILISIIFLLRTLRFGDSGWLYTVISRNSVAAINYGIDLITLSSLVLIVLSLKETIQAVFKVYRLNEKEG